MGPIWKRLVVPSDIRAHFFHAPLIKDIPDSKIAMPDAAYSYAFFGSYCVLKQMHSSAVGRMADNRLKH